MDIALLSPFFQHLLIAAAIGLIVGLEREFNTHGQETHIGGIRTFPLVAIFGFLGGTLALYTSYSFLWLVAGGFFALIALVYYFQVQRGKSGLTTELAMLITLILGIMVALDKVRESLEVVVLVTVILSVKDQVHELIKQVTEEELFAFVKFIVLVLLVLPMLPDQAFGPEKVLNFRELGWIVIIVLSIGFAGYLLLKFGGMRRGILFTAMVGGLFSSTMVAWVFSAKSREQPEYSAAYSAGVVVSSSVMFVRVYALASVFYLPVAQQLFWPLLLLLAVSAAFVFWLFKKQSQLPDSPQLNTGNPLDIKNAAFFAALYIGITLFMYYSRQWMNTSGVYASGALSGMADIDAITISTVKWAAADAGQTATAANIIVIAVLSNTLFKGSMSILRGSSMLRKMVALGFGALLLCGFLWLGIRMI